jgi:hypothetical protein
MRKVRPDGSNAAVTGAVRVSTAVMASDAAAPASALPDESGLPQLLGAQPLAALVASVTREANDARRAQLQAAMRAHSLATGVSASAAQGVQAMASGLEFRMESREEFLGADWDTLLDGVVPLEALVASAVGAAGLLPGAVPDEDAAAGAELVADLLPHGATAGRWGSAATADVRSELPATLCHTLVLSDDSEEDM